MADAPTFQSNPYGSFDPSQWTNPYSQFYGKALPWPSSYAGWPTDATGNPIQKPPGMTLNSTPQQAAPAAAAPQQTGLHSAAYAAGRSAMYQAGKGYNDIPSSHGGQNAADAYASPLERPGDGWMSMAGRAAAAARPPGRGPRGGGRPPLTIKRFRCWPTRERSPRLARPCRRRPRAASRAPACCRASSPIGNRPRAGPARASRKTSTPSCAACRRRGNEAMAGSIMDLISAATGHPDPSIAIARALGQMPGQPGSAQGPQPLAGPQPSAGPPGGPAGPGGPPGASGGPPAPAQQQQQAPPQPQVYQTPPDLGSMFVQLMQHQQANEQFNRGMGMLAAGFAIPRDRASDDRRDERPERRRRRRSWATSSSCSRRASSSKTWRRTARRCQACSTRRASTRAMRRSSWPTRRSCRKSSRRKPASAAPRPGKHRCTRKRR